MRNRVWEDLTEASPGGASSTQVVVQGQAWDVLGNKCPVRLELTEDRGADS